VIAYDYTGYGHSEGEASISEIHTDIEVVSKFARNVLQIQISDLILFGCNIGSIPTLHLATQEDYKGIKGIILISPISSGVRIISNDIKMKELERMKNYDIFYSIRGISNIRCNVLVIHGMKDNVIPFEGSKHLSKHILHLHEWFPKKGDNGNILTIYRTKFLIRVKSFIEYLNYRKSKCPSSEKYSDGNEDFINSCIENGITDLDKISSSQTYNSLKIDLYRHKYNFQNTHSMIASSCPFDSKLEDNVFDNSRDSYQNGTNGI
jgi:hypothetical protein